MLSGMIASAQDHCKGVTKKGEPCKSVIGLKNGYCRVHDPATPRCGAKTAAGKPCRMPVDKLGDRCRFHKGQM